MTTQFAPTRGSDRAAAAQTITVRMGELSLARGHERLRTVGLGSCVAIIVFAPAHLLAALAHCMLPAPDDREGSAARFAATAVPVLVEALRAAGGAAPYSAAIVGGASMFPGVRDDDVRDIPGANVLAARMALAAAAIPIRVEDVGGHVGRSVVVHPVRQRVMVRTLRGGDRWL